jgi:hypothetical protein
MLFLVTRERSLKADESVVSVLGSFGFGWGQAASGSPPRLAAFTGVPRTARSGRYPHGRRGTLWPEASEDHAHASLRSALSRLDRIKRKVVRVTFQELSLADGVAVDIRDA